MKEDEIFKKFIETIQNKIKKSEEEQYSKKVIQEYTNPTNFGFLINPDAKAKIKGPCGDTMKIELKINKEKIEDARFWTDGCGPTIACGNMLTKIIKNLTLNEANKINDSKLLKALDNLPEGHQHCATLSVNTLHKALGNINNNK